MEFHRVPASRGIAWIREGFAVVQSDPALWIADTVLAGALLLGVGLLPVLGMAVSSVLQIVLLAGLLKACQDAGRGMRPELSYLAAGFGACRGRLMLLGLVLLIAWTVVGLALFAPVGALMGLGVFGSPLAEHPSWPDPSVFQRETPLLLTAAAVMVGVALIALPVAMAAWFAPALIMLNDKSVTEALRLSFLACCRNVWPLSVYGGVMVVASVIAIIPFGLGLLILVPVGIASLYVSFSDVFSASSDPEAVAKHR